MVTKWFDTPRFESCFKSSSRFQCVTRSGPNPTGGYAGLGLLLYRRVMPGLGKEKKRESPLNRRVTYERFERRVKETSKVSTCVRSPVLCDGPLLWMTKRSICASSVKICFLFTRRPAEWTTPGVVVETAKRNNFLELRFIFETESSEDTNDKELKITTNETDNNVRRLFVRFIIDVISIDHLWWWWECIWKLKRDNNFRAVASSYSLVHGITYAYRFAYHECHINAYITT